MSYGFPRQCLLDCTNLSQMISYWATDWRHVVDHIHSKSLAFGSVYLRTVLHCVSIKKATRCLLITVANVDRFSKFFHQLIRVKLIVFAPYCHAFLASAAHRLCRNNEHFLKLQQKQEAQLSQSGCATLRVIENLAIDALKVTRHYTIKPLFHCNYVSTGILYRIRDI